jgi:hypothetical protein
VSSSDREPDAEAPAARPVEGPSYALASWLYGRALGIVLVCAFVSLGVQVRPLLGERGLEPAADFVERVHDSPDYGFFDFPSLAFLGSSAAALEWICVLGTAASALLAIGAFPRACAVVAWGSYLSIVDVGFPFTAFQWDLLLLEACVASLPLLPMTALDRPSLGRGPPALARFVLYALVAKLMLGSGLVKLMSGDDAWSSLGALAYHYETQPIPTPMGWLFHQMPRSVHALSCVVMFAIELGMPIAALVPHRIARSFAAAAFVSLMALIALTGNYGFFNLLTVALCIPLVDDSIWRAFVPRRVRLPRGDHERSSVATRVRATAAAIVLALSGLAFAGGIFGGRFFDALLSPISGFQSFNGYGLFAVMTRTRPEIAIEGSVDGREWREYEFRYKAGPLDRPPPFLGPHMPRLDWQMWFAALGDTSRNRWLSRLEQQLLEGDPNHLFESDPFAPRAPRYVRLVYYDYTFTDWQTLSSSGRWWNRTEGRAGPVLAARPPAGVR